MRSDFRPNCVLRNEARHVRADRRTRRGLPCRGRRRPIMWPRPHWKNMACAPPGTRARRGRPSCRADRLQVLRPGCGRPAGGHPIHFTPGLVGRQRLLVRAQDRRGPGRADWPTNLPANRDGAGDVAGVVQRRDRRRQSFTAICPASIQVAVVVVVQRLAVDREDDRERELPTRAPRRHPAIAPADLSTRTCRASQSSSRACASGPTRRGPARSRAISPASL